MLRCVWCGVFCFFWSLTWVVYAEAPDSIDVAVPSPSRSATEHGFLNVFTDLAKAFIVVDGELVSRESLVKYPLALGEHLVQVRMDDKVVYQQTVVIQQNRTSTVVSDHFVDIITSTPSVALSIGRLGDSVNLAEILPWACSVRLFPNPQSLLRRG